MFTRHLAPRRYCVAFDPLDGSSVLGADFAVGSIFGVWPGEDLSGLKGRDQVAAAYAVYGPRTVLVMATPTPENGPSDRGGDASVGRMRVKEFVLGKARTRAGSGIAAHYAT